jgi:MFS family permease
MPIQRRWPAPWVFSLLILPLGMIYGFDVTALPFLLAKAGVPVDRIASVSAIAGLPGVLGLFIAPIVDIKLRRRTWLAIGIFGTAIAACIYFPLIGASHVVLMTALIFGGGMVTFLVMAACGGMMLRMLTSANQSKAAAWTQVGILGGGALSGAMVLWLVVRMPLVAAGFCFAVVTAAVGYVPFTIPEPAPEPSPWFRGRLVALGKEIWAVRGNADGVHCFCYPLARRERRKACCPRSLRTIVLAGAALCGLTASEEALRWHLAHCAAR